MFLSKFFCKFFETFGGSGAEVGSGGGGGGGGGEAEGLLQVCVGGGGGVDRLIYI